MFSSFELRAHGVAQLGPSHVAAVTNKTSGVDSRGAREAGGNPCNRCLTVGAGKLEARKRDRRRLGGRDHFERPSISLDGFLGPLQRFEGASREEKREKSADRIGGARLRH